VQANEQKLQPITPPVSLGRWALPRPIHSAQPALPIQGRPKTSARPALLTPLIFDGSSAGAAWLGPCFAVSQATYDSAKERCLSLHADDKNFLQSNAFVDTGAEYLKSVLEVTTSFCGWITSAVQSHCPCAGLSCKVFLARRMQGDRSPTNERFC
jgi:hypothetical protein